MQNKLDDKHEKIIFDDLITKYISSTNKTLFIIELVGLVGTILLIALQIKGLFPFQITVKVFKVSKEDYFFIQLCNVLINWLVFGLYLFFNDKFSLEHRKILLCFISIFLSAFVVFGNWNLKYMGFLFIIPIIIASPMNKRTNRTVFSICLLLNILYAALQTIMRQNKSNLVISFITTITLIAFYFISISIHQIMYNGMLDIEQQFSSISQELHDEVNHDFLTKAFSLSAFHNDYKNDAGFNSLAVIDVDNFKSINDKYGHEYGDNVLKLLVSVFQLNKERIYRVGGDEFAVLSVLSSDRLADKLKKLKNDFTDSVEDHYSFRTTISIGIMNISNSDIDFSKYFTECDKLMYISKSKGRNKITLDNDFATLIKED